MDTAAEFAAGDKTSASDNLNLTNTGININGGGSRQLGSATYGLTVLRDGGFGTTGAMSNGVYSGGNDISVDDSSLNGNTLGLVDLFPSEPTAPGLDRYQTGRVSAEDLVYWEKNRDKIISSLTDSVVREAQKDPYFQIFGFEVQSTMSVAFKKSEGSSIEFEESPENQGYPSTIGDYNDYYDNLERETRGYPSTLMDYHYIVQNDLLLPVPEELTNEEKIAQYNAQSTADKLTQAQEELGENIYNQLDDVVRFDLGENATQEEIDAEKARRYGNSFDEDYIPPDTYLNSGYYSQDMQEWSDDTFGEKSWKGNFADDGCPYTSIANNIIENGYGWMEIKPTYIAELFGAYAEMYKQIYPNEEPTPGLFITEPGSYGMVSALPIMKSVTKIEADNYDTNEEMYKDIQKIYDEGRTVIIRADAWNAKAIQDDPNRKNIFTTGGHYFNGKDFRYNAEDYRDSIFNYFDVNVSSDSRWNYYLENNEADEYLFYFEDFINLGELEDSTEKVDYFFIDYK